jgi:ribosomal protein L11 methyltransferase
MAFGTGTHETTQLCIRAIEKHYQAGQSFLDVGTGTGILSIAAATLNPAAKVVACDTDADSIRIAKENAELNDVAISIEFYVGTVEETAPKFDFVAANLTIDVITPLLPLLLEKASRTLLLSGILVQQKDAIVSELSRCNIHEADIETAGEWISVVIRRD